MIPVFDSNIVIDFLNGHDVAKDEVGQYSNRAISTVTWIEVMSAAYTQEMLDFIEGFLSNNFMEIGISKNIATIAADLRRQQRKLKLPDAIIWATAMQQNTLLVTRNSKDFPKNDPAIRIPYVLGSH